MELTLSAAAKATGRSKSTLSRAIKRGQVSARQDDAGVYHIDAAELVRVYGWDPDAAPQGRTGRPLDAPQERPAPETEVAVLRTKVEMLTALLDREREATAELRQFLALLPSQARAEVRAPSSSRPRGLLARFLGYAG